MLWSTNSSKQTDNIFVRIFDFPRYGNENGGADVRESYVCASVSFMAKHLTQHNILSSAFHNTLYTKI